MGFSNFIVDPREKEYTELKNISRELKIPVIDSFITMSVNKDNNIIHEHTERSHSWVRNAYNQLLMQFSSIPQLVTDTTYEGGKLGMKDYSGTIATNTDCGYYLDYFDQNLTRGWLANSSVGTHGIVVGTGDSAESFESYDLETRILEGSTSGKFSHNQMDAPIRTYDSMTDTWTIPWIRYFNNNSGGSITVKETGIIANLRYSGSYDYQRIYCLLIRDVLSSPVAVADTAQLKVTYTLTIAVPE